MPYGQAGGSAEVAYLDRLLRDFATDDELTAEEAQERIKSRQIILEKEYETFPERVVYPALKKDDGGLGQVFMRLAIRFHEYLYDGILSNAGEYRKHSDPNQGRVWFGGQRGQRREHKFEGTHPNHIEEELIRAFEHLDDLEDPYRSSIEFYMEFNRVHPFYDANGRVGRLIVTIYLHVCGLYVNWEEIDKRQGKFIRRMNSCHKRADSRDSLYEQYLDYLLNFWERHIEPIDDFYRPEVS